MRDAKVMNGAVALFGKNLSGYTQMSLRLARFRGKDQGTVQRHQKSKMV